MSGREDVIDISSSPEPSPVDATSTSKTSTKGTKRKLDTTNGRSSGTVSTSKKATAPAPKRAKQEPEPSRWPWIDRVRPEMQFKGTKIEAYNCGGKFFKATGKTVADRLDKLEKFLEECDGDETAHPTYGHVIW